MRKKEKGEVEKFITSVLVPATTAIIGNSFQAHLCFSHS